MRTSDYDERIKINSSKYIKWASSGCPLFYIPELNKYVGRFTKNINYTGRTWYNKFILEESENFTPACSNPNCSNLVGNFKGFSYGYPKYCCLSCSKTDPNTLKSRSESIRKSMSKPEVKSRMSKSLKIAFSKDTYKKKLSERSKNQWKDKDYRERNLSKIPRSGSVSKISLELFRELDKSLRLMGYPRSYYGENEKIVMTGSKIGDKSHYRKLDFYNEFLNIAIEFQGDHWHPRDIFKYGCDKVFSSIINDTDRANYIKNSIGCRFYFITESDYVNNKKSVINEILEDIEIYNQCV